MKKLLFLYAAIFIIIVISGFSMFTVFAETSPEEKGSFKKYVTIKVDTANIREEPSLTSDIIEQAYKGTQFEVLQESLDESNRLWYQVLYNGEKGWISHIVTEVSSEHSTVKMSSSYQINEKEYYKIGVNDVLNIKVLDHRELDTAARVSSDGTINFPYLGTLYVKDMKLSEIEEEITKQLSEGYINQPVVTVSLIQSLSRNIFTFGEFIKRGQIPFTENMTVINAFSLAGGVLESGYYGTFKIMRRQENAGGYKKVVENNLNHGFLESKDIENMILQPDDLLIVERSKTFLIQGEVVKHGRFILERNMTILGALLQAGGVTKDGQYGKIKVRRKQEGESGGYKDLLEAKLNDGVIESKEVEDTFLQPDDILIVERSKTFLIQGEVAGRGRYPLEKDMTVVSALLQAGGVTQNGSYGKIKIRRKQEGESGGYTDLVETNLNNGAIENREVEDTLLHPDDILIVTPNESYFIYGEAQRTGEFVLKHDMTVFQALTIAGGLTKWGSENRIKILRPTADGKGFATININIKDVIKGKASADIKLEAGDKIIVSSGIF